MVMLSRKALMGTQRAAGGGEMTHDQLLMAAFEGDLVAYVPLDETSGVLAADLSGNGATGEIAAGVQLAADTFLDGRPWLNINNSFIRWNAEVLGNLLNLNRFSLYFWLQAPLATFGAAANTYLISLNRGDGRNKFFVRAYQSGLQVYYEANDVAKATSVLNWAIDNKPTLVCITVDTDADTLLVYINGELRSTLTAIDVWQSGALHPPSTCIGAETHIPTLPWADFEGRAAIGNRVLTAEQIRALFESLRGTRNMLCIGDSKTAGDVWPLLLRQEIYNANEMWHYEAPARIATAGWTVQQALDYLNANIASLTDLPDTIIINLGSNDSETEIAFKTIYRSLIELLHTKWPAAPIYLARPVLLSGTPPSTPTAMNTTRHGWIDELIADYEYVHAGIDETALEGGDGYATNIADTTHYTIAGQTAAAALWLAVLTA